MKTSQNIIAVGSELQKLDYSNCFELQLFIRIIAVSTTMLRSKEGMQKGMAAESKVKGADGNAERPERGAAEIVIRPAVGFARINLAELWTYRNLLLSLTDRRLKSEFDRQYLAYVWIVARPLLMIVLFTYFRHVSSAKMGVEIPYPLYLYSGLILWFFFVEATTDTSSSIKTNAALIQKVYFPRILTPLAAILANLSMLVIAVVPLVFLMVWFGVGPGWNILLLPLVLLQIAVLILGVGCFFAALGIGSEDWDRFLSFALYIGLFISPIIYSPAMFPEKVQWIYSLNPMSGALLAFRSCFFDEFPWPMLEWIYSCGFSMVIAVIGVLMFQRSEKTLVDRL